VTAVLDELVDSLLYEGYALYPYTPGATKNATPTPFGIVYPPVFAAGSDATFDHLRLECRLAEPGTLSAEVRFLQSSGDGHRAVERRVVLDEPGERPFAFGGLSGRARLRVDGTLVRVCVHNLTAVAEGLGRTDALLSSLISTHVLVRAAGGRFVSPLEAGCTSINTFPVLATPADDVVLGAAIVLPDHPQLATQSRGSLYDATEIEEALLLHVQALSDGERSDIAAGDPAVHAMVERAAAATPQEIFALHGVMQPVDEDVPGESEAVVDGMTVRRGAKLILRPGPGGDAHDFMLAGRTATLERIYIDYDDAVHLAVTVDSDPMQEVLRESGRFLFFKPHEVEVVR
jgi:hypothetical protein